MSKSETQAGRETWEFICLIVSPVVPRVATISQIKRAAYAAFQVGEMFPPGRVDEAAQRRNGWATKAAFEDRAAELGLKIPESPWKINGPEAAQHDANLIPNLNAAIAALYARYGDGNHPEITALREAIRIIKS